MKIKDGQFIPDDKQTTLNISTKKPVKELSFTGKVFLNILAECENRAKFTNNKEYYAIAKHGFYWGVFANEIMNDFRTSLFQKGILSMESQEDYMKRKKEKLQKEINESINYLLKNGYISGIAEKDYSKIYYTITPKGKKIQQNYINLAYRLRYKWRYGI